MENKNVGYLLLGVSIIIISIIFLFNSALKQIVNESCTMAGHESCTMYDTISQQTYLSLGIVGLLIIVSLVLMFSKPKTLLFIFKNPKRILIHNWFVFFPIDLIFLDKDKQIIEMKRNLKPFSWYKSKKPANFLIEEPSK